MKESESDVFNVFSGSLIFKGGFEYFNDSMFIHGYPYYMINKADGIYYLWELDRTNPDSRKYLLMKQSYDYISLYEEAVQLERTLRRQLYPPTWEPIVVKNK
ncbi:MAG TPA: hypothetical protein DCQ37_01630 [Desulfobacteraceae bacterium]|nr:hypothetical protein [Desulfobacteraceae bacterium]